jgi:hypothetical protein
MTPIDLSFAAPVPSIDERSPDAGSILEDEEIDYEWVELDLPLEAFPSLAKMDIRGQTEHERRARIALVDEWMTERGGHERAMLESPALALLAGGDLSLLDGWHRGRALVIRGATTMRTCVGIVPDGESTIR